MNRIALHADSPGHEPDASVDAWSRLSEVRCPVLVVVGDLDLGHIQAAVPRRSRRRSPGAQLAVMEGAAHLPGFEQPAAFAALLRAFLGGPPADRRPACDIGRRPITAGAHRGGHSPPLV